MIETFAATFIILLLVGGPVFIAAYQKALETITKCRSSKTGDVEAIFIDNLCGKVPSPADFGIVGR